MFWLVTGLAAALLLWILLARSVTIYRVLATDSNGQTSEHGPFDTNASALKLCEEIENSGGTNVSIIAMRRGDSTQHQFRDGLIFLGFTICLVLFWQTRQLLKQGIDLAILESPVFQNMPVVFLAFAIAWRVTPSLSRYEGAVPKGWIAWSVFTALAALVAIRIQLDLLFNLSFLKTESGAEGIVLIAILPFFLSFTLCATLSAAFVKSSSKISDQVKKSGTPAYVVVCLSLVVLVSVLFAKDKLYLANDKKIAAGVAPHSNSTLRPSSSPLNLADIAKSALSSSATNANIFTAEQLAQQCRSEADLLALPGYSKYFYDRSRIPDYAQKYSIYFGPEAEITRDDYIYLVLVPCMAHLGWTGTKQQNAIENFLAKFEAAGNKETEQMIAKSEIGKLLLSAQRSRNDSEGVKASPSTNSAKP